MRVLILILACSSPAAADELRLKGGGSVSGVVEEFPDKVVVRLQYGSLAFARDQVECIDRGKSSVLQEFQRRLQSTDLSRSDQAEALLKWADGQGVGSAAQGLREQLGRLRWNGLDLSNASQLEIYAGWARGLGLPGMAKAALERALSLRRAALTGPAPDAEALYRLGLWARANGLPVDALVLFQEAIRINPDHEFARRALGYEFYAGKWRTPTEVKTAMGLVEFEGDWMTPQAKEAILAARTLARERKLMDEARRKLEKERARLAAVQEAGVVVFGLSRP